MERPNLRDGSISPKRRTPEGREPDARGSPAPCASRWQGRGTTSLVGLLQSPSMTPSQVGAHPLLSAFVLTRNEERNIERCLASLDFCDELVLLDAESSDRTVEIARRFTDMVWIEPWRGFSAQRELAVTRCRGEWILWIDADEVVTAELADAIRKAIGASSAGHAGYEVRRRVHYLGAWIDHGGWGDDWVLRLFRRDAGRFSGARVHERVVLRGSSARLSGVLEHYSYRDLSHHWTKIQELAALGAEEARAQGRRTRAIDLCGRPLVRWARMFLWKRGFLDGWRGVVAAGMAAAYVFLKYAILKEKENEK